MIGLIVFLHCLQLCKGLDINGATSLCKLGVHAMLQDCLPLLGLVSSMLYL